MAAPASCSVPATHTNGCMFFVVFSQWVCVTCTCLALPCRPAFLSLCAVCVIVGEFASTSQLVKAGASGSVNVSVWGTPDR